MTKKINTAEKKIIGAAYSEPKKLVKEYAKNDVPLLFLGETGSGKELFAQLFMEESKRKGERRTINCAAVTGDLLNSDIFGHEKGAFTGAITKRNGLLLTCKNGILFLDELGSSSKEFQAAILRVSEMNSFKAVGSDKEITDCDTLIIAATSSLSSIREDLKHRFNILPIPPLQNFDIPEITRHSLKKSLKRSALEMLMALEYPGNVRQLLRRCDQLWVEKGKEIFGKKASDKKFGFPSFNYQKFREEYILWQKYVQPILDEYKVIRITYKYSGRDNRSDKEKNRKDLQFDPNLIMEMANNMAHYREIPYTRTHEGFIGDVRSCIESGSIYLIFDELKKHLPENSLISADTEPDLSHLINIKPYKDASKEFEKFYIKYHLDKNKLKVSETAVALDMNYSTLKSAMIRLGIQVKNLDPK